ncbi:MazG nucleotide pyrophosphohydrolase domain-containing protein [Colwellia sp. MEBiC06753]
MHLKEIAQEHFDWVDAMGWHNKTPLEALALVASEVGEAINECRQATPSEHFGEELADIVLRVLDLAHWQGIDIEKEILEKIVKNKQRGNRGRLK